MLNYLHQLFYTIKNKLRREKRKKNSQIIPKQKNNFLNYKGDKIKFQTRTKSRSFIDSLSLGDSVFEKPHPCRKKIIPMPIETTMLGMTSP